LRSTRKGKLLYSCYFFFAGAAAGAGAATTLSKRAVRAMSFCKLSIEEMMQVALVCDRFDRVQIIPVVIHRRFCDAHRDESISGERE